MKVLPLLLVLIMLFLQPLHAQRKTRIIVHTDDSFDTASLSKMNSAVQMLTDLINSTRFADTISTINFNFNNQVLAGDEVLDFIRSGKNSLTDTLKDYAVDLRIRVYNNYKGNRQTGHIDKKSGIAYSHRCFIQQSNEKCYAIHLIKQYMQQIGFDEGASSAKRKSSVADQIALVVNSLLNNTAKCSYKTGSCHPEFSRLQDVKDLE